MTRNDNLCIWEVKEATKKIAELEESIPLKIKELNDLTESLNEVTWKFRIPTILKGDHRLYGALDNLSGLGPKAQRDVCKCQSMKQRLLP
jgi:hypothetical protein